AAGPVAGRRRLSPCRRGGAGRAGVRPARAPPRRRGDGDRALAGGAARPTGDRRAGNRALPRRRPLRRRAGAGVPVTAGLAAARRPHRRGHRRRRRRRRAVPRQFAARRHHGAGLRPAVRAGAPVRRCQTRRLRRPDRPRAAGGPPRRRHRQGAPGRRRARPGRTAAVAAGPRRPPLRPPRRTGRRAGRRPSGGHRRPGPRRLCRAPPPRPTRAPGRPGNAGLAGPRSGSPPLRPAAPLAHLTPTASGAHVAVVPADLLLLVLHGGVGRFLGLLLRPTLGFGLAVVGPPAEELGEPSCQLAHAPVLPAPVARHALRRRPQSRSAARSATRERSPLQSVTPPKHSWRAKASISTARALLWADT